MAAPGTVALLVCSIVEAICAGYGSGIIRYQEHNIVTALHSYVGDLLRPFNGLRQGRRTVAASTHGPLTNQRWIDWI